MVLAVVTLPRVTAPVAIDYSFWRGYRFSVADRVVKPHGFPRNRLSLPGTAGTVEATFKAGVLRAYPVISVDGVDHPTGPTTPRAVQVIGLLPLISLMLVTGAIGALLTFGAIAGNVSIIREDLSDRVKILLMLTVLAAVVAADLFIVSLATAA
ncbi:hypothetical protein [Nocardioides sp. R-C-SC26]|uniref:hypothetical protein n=1 Tax=Nocardioides sp. R-C-SC26 TaxID=2870414 RepID=UPI001E3EDF29|nr:hypothetical protein [Nocardioides sp. R-C-SC26]